MTTLPHFEGLWSVAAPAALLLIGCPTATDDDDAADDDATNDDDATDDAVYGDVFERWGGLAEQLCAPERMLRPKPDGLSFVEAAALPQSGAIAVQGIRDAGVGEGSRVLIIGGGGGGGTLAVQIAKALGAHVVAVDSAAKADRMRELGADRTVDYEAEDVTRGDERFDRILDLAGRPGPWACRRVLAPGGRYAVVGGPMSAVLGALVGAVATRFTTRRLGILVLKTGIGLDALEAWIAQGVVSPVVDATYPLEQAPAALRRQGDGEATGKLVIVPGGRAG